jgi:UPF0755 protein
MKKNNTFSFCCLIPIIIIIIIIGIISVYAFQQLSYLSPHDSTIKIENGDGLDITSQKLYQESAIPSINIFTLYAYITNDYQNFLAGEHLIPTNSSMGDIIQILQQIPDAEISVTIPEGLTSKEILTKISQNTNLQSSEIFSELQNPDWQNYTSIDFTNNQNLEGFLFPDTYRFNKETTSKDVITKILDNFNSKWENINHPKNNLSDYDILILASIIEKEAASDNERDTIAGILINRIDSGMYLGVNATINYILDTPQSFFSNNETSIDSPYNSYTNLGLPPTPICNPGIKSIEAAINPADTDYLYYFHTPDGQTIFSKTLDEHNNELAKYY